MGDEVKKESSWVPDWVNQGVDYASKKRDELSQKAEELEQQAIAEKDRLLAEAKVLQASVATTARETLEQGRKFVGELHSSTATAATQTAKQATRTFVEGANVRDATTIATVMVDHYVPPLLEGLSDPNILPNLAYHTVTGDYLGLTTDILSIPTQGDPSFTAFGAYLLGGPDKAATAVMMNYDLPTMEMAKQGDVGGVAKLAYDSFTGNYIEAGANKLGWTAVNFVVGGLFSLADFPYYAANLPNQAGEVLTNQVEELILTGDSSLVEVESDGVINSTLYLGAEILDAPGYAGIEATGHFLGNIYDLLYFVSPFTYTNALYTGALEARPIDTTEAILDANSLEEAWDAYTQSISRNQNGFASVYSSAGSDAAKSGGEMVMYDPNLRWDVATVQVVGAVTGFVGSIALSKAKGGTPKTAGIKPTVRPKAAAPKPSPKVAASAPRTTPPLQLAEQGLRAFDDYVAKLEKADHILDEGVANNFIGQVGNFMDQFPAEVRRTFAEAKRNIEERVRNLTEDLILDEDLIIDEVTESMPWDEAVTEQMPPREELSLFEDAEPTSPSVFLPLRNPAPLEGTGPMPSHLRSSRPPQDISPGDVRGLIPSEADSGPPSVSSMDIPDSRRATSPPPEVTPKPTPLFEAGQVVFDAKGNQYYLIKWVDKTKRGPDELVVAKGMEKTGDSFPIYDKPLSDPTRKVIGYCDDGIPREQLPPVVSEEPSFPHLLPPIEFAPAEVTMAPPSVPAELGRGIVPNSPPPRPVPPPPPNVRAVVPRSVGAPPPLPPHLQRIRGVRPEPARPVAVEPHVPKPPRPTMWDSCGASGPMVEVKLGPREGGVAREVPAVIDEGLVVVAKTKQKLKGRVRVIDEGGNPAIRFEGVDNRGRPVTKTFKPEEISSIRPANLNLNEHYFPDIENPQIKDMDVNMSGLEGEGKWVLLDLTDPRLVKFMEEQLAPIRQALQEGRINKAQAAEMAYNLICEEVKYDRGRLIVDLSNELYSMGDFLEMGVCNEMAMLLQVANQYLGIESHFQKGYMRASGGRHAWVDVTDPEIIGPLVPVLRLDPTKRRMFTSPTEKGYSNYMLDKVVEPIRRFQTIFLGEQ